MQSIELTAKSVEEARTTAAAKFGVSPGEVQVTVLEETKGLFGKTNVRVRAESAAAAPAPPPPPAPVAAPEPVAVSAAIEDVPTKDADEAPRAPRGGGRSAKKVSETSPETIANVSDSLNAPPPAEVAEAAGEAEPQVVATAEDSEQLLALVNEILESGDLSVNATAHPSGGRYVNVELDGKDVAFLVGKHGEVLNALQYLMNIAAARRFSNGVRITLDGNNYRERREAALTALATKIAEEVKARREEAVLDALPAFERRVVHKALAVIEGVETYSEGEEPNRKVVIAPAEVS
jgi:spoIIIJ-associated protein